LLEHCWNIGTRIGTRLGTHSENRREKKLGTTQEQKREKTCSPFVASSCFVWRTKNERMSKNTFFIKDHIGMEMLMLEKCMHKKCIPKKCMHQKFYAPKSVYPKMCMHQKVYAPKSVCTIFFLPKCANLVKFKI